MEKRGVEMRGGKFERRRSEERLTEIASRRMTEEVEEDEEMHPRI